MSKPPVKKILPSGQPPPPQPMQPHTGTGTGVQRAVLRVNRACTSCRKHKMRCEGADHPPCARCRSSGIECVFESIKKEHALDSVAVERLGALEREFRSMQGTMREILGAIRGQGQGGNANGNGNGNLGGAGSAGNGTGSSPPQLSHAASSNSNPSPAAGTELAAHLSPIYTHTPSPPHSHSQGMTNHHPHSHTHSHLSQSHHPLPQAQGHHPHPHAHPHTAFQVHSPSFLNGGSHVSPSSAHSVSHSGSTINTHAHHPPLVHNFLPSPDIADLHSAHAHSHAHAHAHARSPGRRRTGDQFKSIPTSAATSDDEGELPGKAFLAPIEVLSDLATAAAAQAGNPSPEESGPNPKKRKLNDGRPLPGGEDGSVEGWDGGRDRGRGGESERGRERERERREGRDVVDKGIVTEEEARELYRIYFSGCYRFLAVFNPEIDTFPSLRQRSPFVLCSILMVASRVRDGGSPPSRVHTELFQEASNLARDTLFSQPQGVECVQAMLLLAGWSSKTGWLAAGHGIRMGMEIGMHKALPRLAAKMRSGRHDPSPDPKTSLDAALVSQARTWLGLFVFELQIGRGTGRPAMIRGDKSISDARVLLTHPCGILTDARLVSTCELLVIQARIHEMLDEERDYDKVVTILREGEREIDDWHTEWDFIMSEKHPDAAGFFRSSAQIQRMYAVLFMHSVALRELRTVLDAKEHPQMHEVMMTAVHNARGCIEICLEAPEYREGLRYAVTYTHTSAAFAAAFLLRFARLFPHEVDIEDSIRMVESLIRLFSESEPIPLNQTSSSLSLIHAFLVPAARFVSPLRQMVEYTHKRWEELKSGIDLPSSLRIAPTPPSHFTNDFQSIMNPPPPPPPSAAPASAPVFDAGMSMFPVDPNSSTMEWAAAVNMLDGFGLPPSMSTNGGSLGWLPNSILGDLAVPPSATEADGNLRDWNLQFAFDV
ncbi:hypothetical protein DACRYDRAFT_111826 [Dacryopinax primogenitus]|uniref:Zn(2)-C6 fungal-type domain-containing protein n=1 Tax=Dacryopinax primogenitus (strain DJM 731) TaxID=1858805 RepID=M5FNE0_DACPD|nr:uncharacterized protein DACRYDRAFT_111826 [Dacryopinax primogenitus]EJT97280.1 hypothetical protein DACRYDRAFT_111826 [Dacryopinax primogenitus]